jgi:voltage-gated potassium channel
METVGAFQLLIVVLPVYVLIALFIDTIFVLPRETSDLLVYIDNGICAIFLADFGIRLGKAENKLAFMKLGWIDLISSIPNLEVFRAGRLYRLVRLIRIARAIRSIKVLISYTFRNRRQGTFSAAAIISVLLVIFASLAILNVEN